MTQYSDIGGYWKKTATQNFGCVYNGFDYYYYLPAQRASNDVNLTHWSGISVTGEPLLYVVFHEWAGDDDVCKHSSIKLITASRRKVKGFRRRTV